MHRVFGLVQVCSASLTGDLRAQWEAHLCGLCLTLRDTRGQWARAFTNTDAVMLSVLVEAQQDGEAERVTVGACPLRGMRTAQVVPSTAVAARLGATASLTLAAAKGGDVLGEDRHDLGGRVDVTGWLRRRVAAVATAPLQRAAHRDEPIAATVGVRAMITDLGRQADIEDAVARTSSSAIPDDTAAWELVGHVLAPTADATARIFRASAELAGRPGNTDVLTEIGAAYGALAHLLDAVSDLERDAKAGAFNPILVTGIGLTAVRRRCQDLVREIHRSFDRLELADDRLVRRLLVDGSHHAVHRSFGDGGSCSVGHGPTVDTWLPPATAPDTPPTSDPAAEPPPGDPRGPRSFWLNLLPWVGVYCTGVACCAEHENPCTGKRHDSAVSGACSGCDGGCCECCNACDSCDGCCCDC